MEFTQKPRIDLAQKYLPRPLYQALQHIFAQGIQGCMLVGGTALAGFYVGHRRSDDLDLFTKDEPSYRSTVLAVKSLKKIGVEFIEAPVETAQYYRATCTLDQHTFTVDVVLDSNVFRVGEFAVVEKNIHVASMKTLLMTKAATLVSRCSEKDLYDLIWLFRQVPGLGVAELLSLGNTIDSGMNAESVLISLVGATLTKNACDFSSSKKIDKQEIYREICEFRKEMIGMFKAYLEIQPAPPLGALVAKVARFKKR